MKKMRCIFCKFDSSTSKSVEHIIPESLGNTEHTLPRGVVCDQCNNYFARKIEGPLLNGLGFKNLRGRQGLTNKRGIHTPQRGFFPAAGIEIEIQRDRDGDFAVNAAFEKDNDVFVNAMMLRKGDTFLIPASVSYDKRLMSRFLGKVGLEVLAHRAINIEGWNDEIVDKVELDPLRQYVRRNEGRLWSFSKRELYQENYEFDDGGQILHEYVILVTDESEFFIVLCIFGTEYAFNLGGPDVTSYQKWLKQNNEKSPLYPEGLPNGD